MHHIDKQNIKNDIAENAEEGCSRGSACLVLHRKEGEQLLAENETGDADSLPQKIAVQRGQLLFIDAENPCPVQESSGNHQAHGDHGNQHGKNEIHRKGVSHFFSLILSHIASAEDLRTADKHHADGVQQMIEGTEHADCGHGRFPNEVTGNNAIDDAVYRINHDEQYLIGDKLKILASDEL